MAFKLESMTRSPEIMRLMINVVAAFLALFIATTGFAQGRPQKLAEKPPLPTTNLERTSSRPPLKPPPGPRFYISPLEGSQTMFSLLLADGSGNTVAGSFTIQQLEIFEAVLEAAKEFALTDERVGSRAPITTRLMEQHEWSLFVDVSKIGDKSRFYISLLTPHGNLTAPAGEITRGSKAEPSALLLNVLSQVRDAKGGPKSSQ